MTKKHAKPAPVETHDAAEIEDLFAKDQEAEDAPTLPPEMPARFSNGGATAEERDAWIAANT